MDIRWYKSLRFLNLPVTTIEENNEPIVIYDHAYQMLLKPSQYVNLTTCKSIFANVSSVLITSHV